MPHDIILSPQAIKDLKNLNENETARIISTLEQLQDPPACPGDHLQNVSLYSLHIGEYTVLLDIIPRKLLIHEIRSGHQRSNNK